MSARRRGTALATAAVVVLGGAALATGGRPTDPGTAALDALRAPGEDWTYDQAFYPAGSEAGRAYSRPVSTQVLTAVCGEALDWLAAAERRLTGASPDSGARATALGRCTDAAWLTPLVTTIETPLGPALPADGRRVSVRLAQLADPRGARVAVVVSSSPDR